MTEPLWLPREHERRDVRLERRERDFLDLDLERRAIFEFNQENKKKFV